jgi:cyclopropane fatty-acyl-phospholipid synthase-like methyltransferase
LAVQNQVQLNAVCSDWQSFAWQKASYDNMVAVFIQFVGPVERFELFRRMDEALKPGGLLLIQGYSPEQLNYNTGGPGKLENLYTEELLREAFPHYRVLDCRTYTEVIEEGTAHSGHSALVGFSAIKL